MFLFGTGCIRLFCKACIFSWCYIFICSWRCSFPFLLIILKNHSILHKIGSILHFRFCSVMNVYTICHIPAQIPFVEKSRSSLNIFLFNMVKKKKKKKRLGHLGYRTLKSATSQKWIHELRWTFCMFVMIIKCTQPWQKRGAGN